MKALSVEAKVLLSCYWRIIPKTSLSFDRPAKIHPKTRKGLTDLVEAGLLTEKPRNRIPGCPLDFEPTEEMAEVARASQIDMDWLAANDFPLTLPEDEV